MVDLSVAKPLSQVIAGRLGIGRQSGRRTFWPCPKHEDRTPSLTICPDGMHFKCFSCGWSGDAITWLRDQEGLSFRQAAERVGARIENGPQPIGQSSTPHELPRTTAPPSVGWQSAALRIVERAETTLWSDIGDKPRRWLNSRGLCDETIREARLGFIPANGPIEGFYADSGIVIPWIAGDSIRFLQIRRYSGDPKYRAITGGTRGGWYPNWPRAGRPVLVVEGEFDALLARQELGDLVEAATLGAATDKITSDVASAIVSAPAVLVATDNDPAGEKTAADWRRLTARARRVTPPAKDITDAYCHGADLRAWLLSHLPSGSIDTMERAHDEAFSPSDSKGILTVYDLLRAARLARIRLEVVNDRLAIDGADGHGELQDQLTAHETELVQALSRFDAWTEQYGADGAVGSEPVGASKAIRWWAYRSFEQLPTGITVLPSTPACVGSEAQDDETVEPDIDRLGQMDLFSEL